jgi:hypothetical protein
VLCVTESGGRVVDAAGRPVIVAAAEELQVR